MMYNFIALSGVVGGRKGRLMEFNFCHFVTVEWSYRIMPIELVFP